MLRSKSFVIKTKNGRILKIVREHYLRDDIWCGSKSCTTCGQNSFSLVAQNNITKSSLFQFVFYILVDTNVVLHQVRL